MDPDDALARDLAPDQMDLGQDSEPVPQPIQPPPAFIEPTADEVTALTSGYFQPQRRVALGERRPARTFLDGPAIGQRPVGPWPYGPLDLVVVASTDIELRVLYRTSGVTLLIYVERVGLSPVLHRAVWLAPTPSPFTGENGVEVPSGTGFEILGEQANWLRVAVDFDGTQTLNGWIPRDAVGDIYTPAYLDVGGLNGEIEPGAEVYRQPGKQSFVRMPALNPKASYSDDYTHSGAVLEARGKWLRIRYSEGCGGGLRVTGWVSSQQAKQVEPFGIGRGCGRGGGDKSGLDRQATLPTIPVSKGQLLLDRPHGHVIGKVEFEQKLATDGHGKVFLKSAWGPIPAVLAPSEARLSSSEKNLHTQE